MTDRSRWQYCQVEVNSNNTGMLKQFFPDRLPVETDLHQGWPAMLGKLGEQGWEMVSVLQSGRSVIYVFKRILAASNQPNTAATPPAYAPPPTQQQQQPPQPPEEKGPVKDFEPLDFS